MWGLRDDFMVWLTDRRLELQALAYNGRSCVLDRLAPYMPDSITLHGTPWKHGFTEFVVFDLSRCCFTDLHNIFCSGSSGVGVLEFLFAFMWRYGINDLNVGAAMLDTYTGMWNECGPGEERVGLFTTDVGLCTVARPA